MTSSVRVDRVPSGRQRRLFGKRLEGLRKVVHQRTRRGFIFEVPLISSTPKACHAAAVFRKSCEMTQAHTNSPTTIVHGVYCGRRCDVHAGDRRRARGTEQAKRTVRMCIWPACWPFCLPPALFLAPLSPHPLAAPRCVCVRLCPLFHSLPPPLCGFVWRRSKIVALFFFFGTRPSPIPVRLACELLRRRVNCPVGMLADLLDRCQYQFVQTLGS
ncbi:hypothetical protein K461DRAFT_134290 [Myriangium duriaei CBS 260.36]|uniref:Uncharacterized protein n=1 Tax=Myriangium duriaei CBS 260.36 TaxID=1168546 RepID=A0A9P4J058_9PEZI|nr:hypothetical protein K461DRAFT_134290 [Myriangium duriaei CBS 260.36]